MEIWMHFHGSDELADVQSKSMNGMKRWQKVDIPHTSKEHLHGVERLLHIRPSANLALTRRGETD